MLRSKKYAFVSFCLLAQGVRAAGIVKHHAAVVTPIINLLIEKKINIIQMMCPELIFDGFYRRPCGKPKYDNFKNRQVCQRVAQQVVWLMDMLINNGHSINVIIGVDFSPSCAVNNLTGKPRTRKRIKGQGIFIEELRSLMTKHNIRVPFIGAQMYRINDTLEKLNLILEGGNEKY
jgi:predicted secreted protein